ncbi:Ig-like domain-containing protein [Ancylobacter sp. A5.8]|uniref:Ig-like domain-containing protein n=1 Tax=Ancylobacter gelatini TaxID=2919920 RepID=UPI001F4EEDA4|nr:Ig-like domain-containing protein [Ancylobacter gelatini]MCJ8143740.1 Ig-like domain-containing protein [Ancylobacter gelatini]
MHLATRFAVCAAVTLFASTAAHAACTGSNGRGWGSGKGAGMFEMTTADKTCRIGFTNVINDQTGARIPANSVAVTTPPKSGKVAVTGSGLVYTPNAGFKGKDRFCTRNTTPKVPGTVLSGCITVSVK